MPKNPFISIVIPTYKRLPSLKVAVHSILEQSYSDWELIIADDETPPGLSWKWLEEISATDLRIRPVQHWHGQGQVENTNFGMAQAKGEWIKLLHDDDRLLPNALEILAQVAQGANRRIVLITTGVCKKESNRNTIIKTISVTPVVCYPGNDAIYRMYMQNESGGTIPSSMMLRANLFNRGVQFENLVNLPTMVDSWFKVLLLQHGDLLHVNHLCVVKPESESRSITNMANRFDLDREFEVIRELIFPYLDPVFAPPSLDVVKGQVRLIRSLHRLSKWHPVEAFKIACTVSNPLSWWLAIKWLLRYVMRS